MNFSIVKQHPYASAAVAAIVVIVAVIVARSSGGGGSSSGSSVSGSGSNSQLAAVNAATAANNAVVNAQVETVQLGAMVAARQSDNALAAQRDTNTTALSIVKEQTARDIAAASIVTGGQTDIAHLTTAADVEKTRITANAAVGIAQTNANAAVSISNNQTGIQRQVVASAGLDKGRSSTGWAQIISAFFGQGPQAIAANQPSNVANSASSIIGALNPSKLLGAFFG
jgi:hypothetical protein